MEGTKRKLSLNLSFLSFTDFTRQASARKSPRNFEDPNGAVGLGILAAVNDNRCNRDLDLSRKVVVAISPTPASTAIPILGKNAYSEENRNENLEWSSREEYTCVISRIGENLIQRREYFGSLSGEKIIGSRYGGDSDFLNYCFLCKKILHGLDIFMYRGEMAFCSPECRDRQICNEKKEEKCKSRLRRKEMEYSVSPSCSDSHSFCAEVAAA